MAIVATMLCATDTRRECGIAGNEWGNASLTFGLAGTMIAAKERSVMTGNGR